MLSRERFHYAKKPTAQQASKTSLRKRHFPLQALWQPKCSFLPNKNKVSYAKSVQIATLTRQCDDKQRPEHESTPTGAWWEEDLLDTAEPLHEPPVQFKPNIGQGKE